MRTRFVLWVLLVGCSWSLKSQIPTEIKLAKQYLDNQEFEKAELLFQNLYSINPKEVFPQYLTCLTSLRKYAEAIEISKKELLSD